jgi:hypothetical protein
MADTIDHGRECSADIITVTRASSERSSSRPQGMYSHVLKNIRIAVPLGRLLTGRSIVGRWTKSSARLVLLPLIWAVPAHAEDDLPDLPVIRTKYYRIHTDINRELALDLGERMDAMFGEYQRRLANFRTEKAAPAMEVYLFQRQKDYLRFTGERWRNSGGVFMSGRNLLAAFLEGQGRDALRRTLQHEAFHQFAHQAISPNMPVWLNEGMAQLFEEGIWTGDGFLLGQVPPRRIRQLKEDLKGRVVPFDEMLAMTPDKWAEALAGDHGKGATQYNQSWAMVHFLVQARDVNGREKFRGRLVQMLTLLHAGMSGKEAFERAFSSNVKGFQDRFVEYASTLEPTAEANLIERQEVLADFLIELKSTGHVFNRIGDLREAAVRSKLTLQYSDRSSSWSTHSDVRKYFSNDDGRLFDSTELFFSFRTGAPLPDIVCRASPRLQFRTRFHPAGDKKLEREVLIEAPNGQANAGD